MPFENMPSRDLWQYLSDSEKPIVLYGMGDGADKIIAQLSSRGIEYADIFASDEFVRGQSFHGKRVLRFSDVEAKYDDFIILVCFATSLKGVLDRVIALDRKYELYLPDVPVCGGEVFTRDFFDSHIAEFEKVYTLLGDAESKKIYENVIAYKLSGRLCYLLDAVSDGRVPYGLLDTRSWRVAVDAGAYIGDTAQEMLAFAPSLERVYAIEPDPRTFKKLAALDEPRIVPINAAVSSECGKVTFNAAGGRGARRGSGKREIGIDAISVDSLSLDRCDYVKYDVEGEEALALAGSLDTITRCSPSLLISLYHRSEDIFELPLFLAERFPDINLYLRRRRCVPAWDLDLICIFEEKRHG